MAKIKFKDLGLSEDYLTVEALSKALDSENPEKAYKIALDLEKYNTERKSIESIGNANGRVRY